MYSEYTQNYMRTWMKLYEEMSKKGFTWGSLLENDEWNQYMSFDLEKMTQEQWNRIMKATEDIAKVLQKTYEIISGDVMYLPKLCLPYSTWGLHRVVSKYFSYFTRMDLIVNGDDIRIIEVNCDTPTGMLESSVANDIICDEHGENSPNSLRYHIMMAWEKIIEEYGIRREDKIFFTSYDWHEEDRRTTEFLRMYCPHDNTEYIGLKDIFVANDGIYTPDGRKIEFLYRLYPIEYLDLDVDSEGNKIGHTFINHIVEGRVKVINPPSAFLIQSKCTMALIWELHEEKSSLYTEEEHAIIERHFLPTYYKLDKFDDQPFVAKPIFGREGGGVTVFDGGSLEEDTTDYYYNQRKIYQKYVEMPDKTISTWDGEYTGKLLVGSFLIGGNPAGLFLRVGEKITGNLSMFYGVTIED